MLTYYTYAYLRKDGTPYYIGKGTGRRAYHKHGVSIPPKDRIVFLKQNLSEQQAHEHEICMIAMFGRKDIGTGILRNRTDGGEGTSGRKLSEETKQKMSASALGIRCPEEAKKKISEAVSGFKWYHNGEQSIQAREHPGEGWVEGRIISWELPRNTGMKWYHKDGVRKMFTEDPGDGWELGMPKPKGKRYYNNGSEHVLAYEPPAEYWVPGRLRKRNG